MKYILMKNPSVTNLHGSSSCTQRSHPKINSNYVTEWQGMGFNESGLKSHQALFIIQMLSHLPQLWAFHSFKFNNYNFLTIHKLLQEMDHFTSYSSNSMLWTLVYYFVFFWCSFPYWWRVCIVSKQLTDINIYYLCYLMLNLPKFI